MNGKNHPGPGPFVLVQSREGQMRYRSYPDGEYEADWHHEKGWRIRGDGATSYHPADTPMRTALADHERELS